MVAVGLDLLDPWIIGPHHCIYCFVRPVLKVVCGVVRVDLPRQHGEGGDGVWTADEYNVGDLIHCILQHGAAVKLRFRAPDEAELLDERLHGARLHDTNIPRHGGAGKEVDLHLAVLSGREHFSVITHP